MLHYIMLKLSMEEIRKSEFDIDNKTNGFVVLLAFTNANPKIQK